MLHPRAAQMAAFGVFKGCGIKTRWVETPLLVISLSDNALK